MLHIAGCIACVHWCSIEDVRILFCFAAAFGLGPVLLIPSCLNGPYLLHSCETAWTATYPLLLLLLLLLLVLLLPAGTTAVYSGDGAGAQKEKAGLPGGGRGGSWPAQMLASGIDYFGRGLLGESTYCRQHPVLECAVPAIDVPLPCSLYRPPSGLAVAG